MKFPFVKRKKAEKLARQLDEAKQRYREMRDERNALRTEFKELMKGEARNLLAKRFLRGQGIEVGALHRPTPTAPGSQTKYYDYLTAEQNYARNPKMADENLVSVDYVGNGEKLELLEDGSQDYIIANHMLEHCENVIGTLRTFWRKLRGDGALLISLPDKRYTFDFKRPPTPFEHLVRDDKEGPQVSRYEHYLEFHDLAFNTPPESRRSQEQVEKMDHLDIHFHVWTEADIIELFTRLSREAEFGWEIDAIMRYGNEVVTVVRKQSVECYDREKPETRSA